MKKEEVIMNWVESLLQAGLIIVVLLCISGAILLYWDIRSEAKKDRETKY